MSFVATTQDIIIIYIRSSIDVDSFCHRKISQKSVWCSPILTISNTITRMNYHMVF